MTDELFKQAEKAVNALDSISSASPALLTLLACWAVGFVLKKLPFVPNQYVPTGVFAAGPAVMLATSSFVNSPLPIRAWVVRNVVAGLVISAVAWVSHRYLLKAAWAYFQARFPSAAKQVEAAGQDTVPPFPISPSTPQPQIQETTKGQESMKTPLMIAALLTVGLLATEPVRAQTLPTTPPTTNDFLTNIVHLTGGSAVATFALNLLPYWDKTQTNAFGSGEILLETAPVWKSANAGGATPYLSIGGTYFFTENFGAGGEVLTFGNGQGTSTIDSAHLLFTGRKALGNVAGYLMLGGGRDFNRNLYDAEVGVGVEFRYTTGMGFFTDTRYCYLFDNSFKSADHEFLTRVGITLHF